MLKFNEDIKETILSKLSADLDFFQESQLWIILFNSLLPSHKDSILNYVTENNLQGLTAGILGFPQLESIVINNKPEVTSFIIEVIGQSEYFDEFVQKIELSKQDAYRIFSALFRHYGSNYKYKPISLIYQSIQESDVNFKIYPVNHSRSSFHYEEIVQVYLSVEAIFGCLNNRPFLEKFSCIDTPVNILYNIIPQVFPNSNSHDISFRIKAGDSSISIGESKYNLNNETAFILTADIIDSKSNKIKNAINEAQKIGHKFKEKRQIFQDFAEKTIGHYITNPSQ